MLPPRQLRSHDSETAQENFENRGNLGKAMEMDYFKFDTESVSGSSRHGLLSPGYCR